MSLLPKNEKVIRDSKSNRIKMLIYGAPMIGKTTLASKFPNALILSTDGNFKGTSLPAIVLRKAMTVNGKAIELAEFIKLFKEEISKDTSYETIIVDLFDDVIDYLEFSISKAHRVETIGEIPHGKGWELAAKATTDFVRTLSATGKNIILIAREKSVKIEDTRGKIFDKFIPQIREKTLTSTASYLDFIFRAGVEPVLNKEGKTVEQRMLYIQPAKEHYVAWRPIKQATQEKILLNYEELTKQIY